MSTTTYRGEFGNYVPEWNRESVLMSILSMFEGYGFRPTIKAVGEQGFELTLDDNGSFNDNGSASRQSQEHTILDKLRFNYHVKSCEKVSSVKRSYITEHDGEYTVHGHTGREFGTYKSKGEAEKRLKQIEYYKNHPDAGKSSSFKAGLYETDEQWEDPRHTRVHKEEMRGEANPEGDLSCPHCGHSGDDFVAVDHTPEGAVLTCPGCSRNFKEAHRVSLASFCSTCGSDDLMDLGYDSVTDQINLKCGSCDEEFWTEALPHETSIGSGRFLAS